MNNVLEAKLCQIHIPLEETLFKTKKRKIKNLQQNHT